MIKNAEEFVKLRLSDDPEEYNRASNDEAPIDVWLDVIKKYPDMKEWVIHNKQIQIEILTILADDESVKVKSCIARKRKIIDTPIFDKLANDESEDVRLSLAFNTKISQDLLKKIDTSGSTFFKRKMEERMKNMTVNNKN